MVASCQGELGIPSLANLGDGTGNLSTAKMITTKGVCIHVTHSMQGEVGLKIIERQINRQYK